jgi:hypothetical protein
LGGNEGEVRPKETISNNGINRGIGLEQSC